MDYTSLTIISLLAGWLLDLLLGDPAWWPHPVVLFGKIISRCEKVFNRSSCKRLKGGIVAVILIVMTFAGVYGLELLSGVSSWSYLILNTFLIFSCLAGTTLIREAWMVFRACDEGIEAGRRQVARIVGRDTSQLTQQEVKTAALETLAENLSDGVVAPLFWLIIAGVPGMVTYKMINTLDSMIGYRTERYRRFGTVAARIDDVANWIPARLTALLMALASLSSRSLKFVLKYGHHHASPNSGYPEAALAGILDCRFGGPHIYHGELIDKPFIGERERNLSNADMRKAAAVNRIVEIIMVGIAVLSLYLQV